MSNEYPVLTFLVSCLAWWVRAMEGQAKSGLLGFSRCLSLCFLLYESPPNSCMDVILKFHWRNHPKLTWAAHRAYRVTHSQWVKVFATKPDDMSSIYRTHMAEGKSQFLQVDLWPPHVCPHLPPNQYKNVSISMTYTTWWLCDLGQFASLVMSSFPYPIIKFPQTFHSMMLSSGLVSPLCVPEHRVTILSLSSITFS